MPLSAARRTGLVDQVIEQLRESVSSGEWPLGHRIPNEADLVEALGVGRNTVREAVRALSHAGILEVRQGDGTYVRATSEVSGALRRLCGAELRDVLQVRRCLEVEGARLAAAQRTDADLARLRELLAIRNECEKRGSRTDFARADTDFHLAVMDASHNAMLAELYRGLVEVITASVASTADDPDLIVDHGLLVEHIAAGSGDRAAGTAAELFDGLLSGVADCS
jgi:DNA-binding FadR family transcriptional regulator